MLLAGNVGAPGGMFRTNLKVCVDKRKVYMGRHAKRFTSVRHYVVFLSFLQLHWTKVFITIWVTQVVKDPPPPRQPHKYSPVSHPGSTTFILTPSSHLRLVLLRDLFPSWYRIKTLHFSLRRCGPWAAYIGPWPLSLLATASRSPARRGG
jgi:hypothetical protein